MLKTNAQAYRNIVPFNGGVWGQSCHLEISNPDSGSASFRLREVYDETAADRPELLRAYTLDELTQQEAKTALLLVKVDIEGAESELFRRPAAWMQSFEAMVIELHDWLLPGQGTSTNLFRRLADQQFDAVLQGENLLVFRVEDKGARATAVQDVARAEPALTV